MPAAATLEDLKRVHEEIQSLRMKHPEAFEDFAALFKRNRAIGYKNISKMLMGDATPEDLRGDE